MTKKINKIETSIIIRICTIILSVILTFILSSILITIAGASPAEAFAALFRGAFSNVNRMAEILVKATPFLLAGLAVSVAFKGGFWNIGVEGQIYMGAIAATVVGLKVQSESPFLLIPLVLGASFLAGGLWALIPGILKAKLGINEIILTMMMNYIAISFSIYLCHEPLRDPGGTLPQTGEISQGAWLPVIIDKTRLHGGLILALLCCFLLYLLFKKTVPGYKIRAAGENPKAAFYGGVNVTKTLLITVFISGGLAGFAGMGEICGIHHRLLDGISPGYGYTGIVVALLGRLHPGGILIASLLFAFLEIGAGSMQRAVGIPSSLVSVIEALIVIFILGSEILEKKSEFFMAYFKKTGDKEE